MVRVHSVGDIETGEPEFLDDHPEAVTCCVSSVSNGQVMFRSDLIPISLVTGTFTRHWLY